ncbi:MAG: 1-phosphofructokinase family hexose kinase [Chitinophagaceae bacterium]|nr:1-phosphofructokinase family hexose kinase [Chitinophagaceae bacterium]
MPAIFTLTFNPCIDINTSVEALQPEVKLRCSEPLVQPGGGGINVARAITKLGGHATALFPCGGDNGRKLKGLLSGENVAFISADIEGNTRENVIVTEHSTGCQYRFNMPGPKLDATACNALLSAVSSQSQLDYLVVSGSLPMGILPEVFKDLKTIAQSKKAMLVVDTSGEALKKAAVCKPDLIKLSVHELASFTGAGDLSSLAEIEFAARRLLNSGIRSVVVSLGPRGALWMSGEQHGHIRAPMVKTISTVGAGDSMVAGIVLSLSKGRPLSEAVEYGVACGSAATMHPGTTLCKKDEVEKIVLQMMDKTKMHEKDTGHRGRA